MDNINQEFKEYLNEVEMKKQLAWYSKKYGPYIEKRGLKDNWKNLFRKPTLLEWTILFMLVMGLFSAWAYNQDIQSCRDFVKTFNENPCSYCKVQTQQPVNPLANFSNLIIQEDLTGGSGG